MTCGCGPCGPCGFTCDSQCPPHHVWIRSPPFCITMPGPIMSTSNNDACAVSVDAPCGYNCGGGYGGWGGRGGYGGWGWGGCGGYGGYGGFGGFGGWGGCGGACGGFGGWGGRGWGHGWW